MSNLPETAERPDTLTAAGGAPRIPDRTITGSKIEPPEDKPNAAARWLGYLLGALIVGAAFLFVITIIVALVAALGALL